MNNRKPSISISSVQNNCTLSDAKDNGIYSMCMLFLRLRNMFKWEKGMQPWEEADSGSLIDWIDKKESLWSEIENDSFAEISVGQNSYSPFDTVSINKTIQKSDLVYGAGHGKSMKAVFFLAQTIEVTRVHNFETVILGKEFAKELDSPFGLAQNDTIYFRTEPFRYFLWDRIFDAGSAKNAGLKAALDHYGLLKDNENIHFSNLKKDLDQIVALEKEAIIHHEVGELLDTTLDRTFAHSVTSRFVGTIVELLVRALRDVFADLNDNGMLGWIIAQKKLSSFGFYIFFADGLRRVLLREIMDASCEFLKTNNWDLLENAKEQCFTANADRARILKHIISSPENPTDQSIIKNVNSKLVAPLKL